MIPIVCIPAYRPSLSMPAMVAEIVSLLSVPVVVVDDGSGPEFEAVFASVGRIPGVCVLRHAVNLGKGQALKTAFNHVLLHHLDCSGVVTADADGQHAPRDIARIAAELARFPHSLVLGSRTFAQGVPWRSRIGNSITAIVFSFFLGKRVPDTQTGLRAIPTAFLPRLMRIQSTGYEFETEMLVCAVRDGLGLHCLPIETIYEDGNPSSHFNPLWDSMKIYYVFFRFCSSSIISAALDFLLFFFAYWVSTNILFSSLLARCGSGAFNFYTNKMFTFKSVHSHLSEALRYISLALAILAASYSLIVVMVDLVGLNVYLSKIMVETFLFVTSFTLQQTFVFRGGRADALETDNRDARR